MSPGRSEAAPERAAKAADCQLQEQTTRHIDPPLLLEPTVSPYEGAVGDEVNRRAEAWASYGVPSASETTSGYSVTDVHPPRAEEGLTTSLTGEWWDLLVLGADTGPIKP